MPSRSRRRGPGAGARGPRSAGERQRAESARIAVTARRPGAARDPRTPARGDALTRPQRGAPAQLRATGILLRFISCGLLSLGAGLTWRLTLAPRRLGPTSVALGCLVLLAGFVVGGLLWYLRDARLRLRDPRLVDDERIVFSFIVFAVVPFLVLALVAVVYGIALLVGHA